MGEELRDLRTKITEKVWSVLQAKSLASGEDMNVIVRDVLSVWADRELHELKVMSRVLNGQGLMGDSPGNQP